MHDLLKRLRKKPFYYWNKFKREGGAQSFNDMIGLPKKNGIPQPFCDYQYMIYKALIIPNYINSKPTTGYPLCHSMTEKKLKEKEREQYFHAFKLKHLWIKKATGLGITEFMLRFMAWLCLRNDDYKNSQMVIITGPNQELAIKCIKRMKELFEPHGITFDSKGD